VTAAFAGVRAVGFDLDGTLIDTLPDLASALNGMLQQLEQTQLTEARIRTLVGDGAESLVQRALAAGARAGAPEPPVREALAIFKDIYSRQMFSRSRLYPQVMSTLQSLAAAGLALCCITNKDEALAQPLMRAAGFEAQLAFTIGTRRREDRKPRPAMLLRACQRLGIEPGQMLYVGDSSVDMQAAHAAGCRAVAVSYGYDERIGRGDGSPEVLIDSLPELTALDGLLPAPHPRRS
jgi:phosphoglycolate phosphatase